MRNYTCAEYVNTANLRRTRINSQLQTLSWRGKLSCQPAAFPGRVWGAACGTCAA